MVQKSSVHCNIREREGEGEREREREMQHCGKVKEIEESRLET